MSSHLLKFKNFIVLQLIFYLLDEKTTFVQETTVCNCTAASQRPQGLCLPTANNICTTLIEFRDRNAQLECIKYYPPADQ